MNIAGLAITLWAEFSWQLAALGGRRPGKLRRRILKDPKASRPALRYGDDVVTPSGWRPLTRGERLRLWLGLTVTVDPASCTRPFVTYKGKRREV